MKIGAPSKWFRCWHSYWSHGLFYSFNEFQSYFLQNLPNSSFSSPWISFSTCLITHSRISVAGFLSRTGFQGQHTLCLISLSDQPDELWAPIQNAPLAIPCVCVRACVCVCVCVCVKSLSHVWLFCNPMDCSPSGSPVHRIFHTKNTGVGCHFLL